MVVKMGTTERLAILTTVAAVADGKDRFCSSDILIEYRGAEDDCTHYPPVIKIGYNSMKDVDGKFVITPVNIGKWRIRDVTDMGTRDDVVDSVDDAIDRAIVVLHNKTMHDLEFQLKKVLDRAADLSAAADIAPYRKGEEVKLTEHHNFGFKGYLIECRPHGTMNPDTIDTMKKFMPDPS